MSLSSWVRSSLGIGSKPQKVEYSRWNEYLPEVFLKRYSITAVFRQPSSHKPITLVEFRSLPHDLLTTGLAREKPMLAVVQERRTERNKIGQHRRTRGEIQNGWTRGEIQKELYKLTPQSVPEVYDLFYERKSGREPESEFILMQYLPYPPLSEVRVSQTTMTEIVAQLVLTLTHWHDNGWYHCGFGFLHVLVKKEVGILSRKYHPYIIDYGDIVDCKDDNITGGGFNDFMNLHDELRRRYGEKTAKAISDAAGLP